VKHAGILDEFDLTREDAEALIMQARVKAGWIKEEDLAPPPAAADAPAETSEAQA
jgi:N utilization substance protein A